MFDRDKLSPLGWAAAAAVVVVVALRVLGGGGPEPAPVALSGEPARRAPGAGAAGGGHLVVYVAGAVRRPGVYRVPLGARIDAAVQLAGGVTRRADRTGVNLAAPLRDGQQVVVPARRAASPGGSSPAGAGGAGSGGGPISLASATVEQLETLDGIGPTLAKRIIEYRDAHGGFRSVEELQQVDGIGEKRFAALKDAVQP